MTKNQKIGIGVVGALGTGFLIGWLVGRKKGNVNISMVEDPASVTTLEASMVDSAGNPMTLSGDPGADPGFVTLPQGSTGSPVNVNLPPGSYSLDVKAYGG